MRAAASHASPALYHACAGRRAHATADPRPRHVRHVGFKHAVDQMRIRYRLDCATAWRNHPKNPVAAASEVLRKHPHLRQKRSKVWCTCQKWGQRLADTGTVHDASRSGGVRTRSRDRDAILAMMVDFIVQHPGM